MRTSHLIPTALLLLSAAGCGSEGSIGPPETLTLGLAAGDAQVGTVGQPVPSPLSVRVTADGTPRAGVPVTFTVRDGDATLSSTEAVTDDAGTASTAVVLGERAGRIVVHATGEGVEGSPAVFQLTSTPDVPAEVRLLSGDGQLGFIGRDFRDPVRVRVTDRFGNGEAGVTVTWEVREGGGAPPPAVTANDRGEASVTWTAGPTPGRNVLAVGAGPAPPLEVTGTGVSGGTGRIALAEWGVGGIYLMNPDGSDFRPLPNAVIGDRNPVWSRDGTWLAFNTLRYGDLEVAAIRRDGSGLVRVTTMPRDGYAEVGSWSPDGSEILVTGNEGPPSETMLYVVNADGTGTRQVIPNSEGGFDADWSPDGSKIVFYSGRPVGGVYLINRDGTGRRLVADGEHPRWSPDGSRIAFVGDVGNGRQPLIMNADGTGIEPLPGVPPGFPGPNEFVGWSPDGTKVLLRGGVEDDEFWSVNVDGTDLIRITNDEMMTLGGAWGRLPEGSSP